MLARGTDTLCGPALGVFLNGPARRRGAAKRLSRQQTLQPGGPGVSSADALELTRARTFYGGDKAEIAPVRTRRLVLAPKNRPAACSGRNNR